ncbi:MAG TPA: enoyl-CoA hydratase/isomerase family protein [Allosphingosinicella sp.]|nr:enoyl-CoA hydratase/isomerase family protein [Allosphingosinicella sp.]
MFLLERNDEHARLTLNRPEARNAIPAAGWTELTDTIGRVAESDVRMLVVTGAGGAFCAGADLGDFPAMRGDEPAVARFREDMRTALDALRGLAIPTLAVVEGACYGAGVALAIACDIRVAANVSEFAITPAKIGISYPQEDVHRLVALIGPGHAARMLFTAGKVYGGEAVEIGLADYHSRSETEVIEAILANDPESLRALKQAIALAAENVRKDADMDARFDAMLAGEEAARRLEALRRK